MDVAARMASEEFTALAMPALQSMMAAARLHAGFLRASMILRASAEDSKISASAAIRVLDNLFEEAVQSQYAEDPTSDTAVEAALAALRAATWRLSSTTPPIPMSPIDES